MSQLQGGKFGLVFGLGESAVRHIITVIVFMLFSYAMIYSFIDFEKGRDAWELVKPYLLMGIGYLVGNSVGKN